MAFVTPPPPSIPPPASLSTPPPPQSSTNVVVPSSRRRRPPAFSIPNLLPSQWRTIQFTAVDVYGRRKLPTNIVNEHFSPLLNRRIPMQMVHDAIAAVNRWFDRNEFVCSRVILGPIPLFLQRRLTLFSLEPRLAKLTLQPVDRDGRPDPEGRIATRPGTISNALGMHVSDVFVWRSAGFARLMALGLFEYANAEVKVLSNEGVELVLCLCERKPGRVEPGAGISSDGRVYGDVSVVDNNFMGRAQRLRVEWQKRIDATRFSGGVAFEDMRVGARIPLTFRMRAYRDSMASRGVVAGPVHRPGAGADRQGADLNVMSADAPLRYEKDRDGLLVDVGYRPEGRNVMFSMTPMLEYVHPNVVDVGGTSLTQTVLQTAMTHATRLPVDCPRRGHLLRIDHYVGAPVQNMRDIFQKVVVRATQYVGVGSRGSVAAGFTVGVGSDHLPWHERKSVGGQATVRGYEYGELGRYVSYGCGRVELRVPLAFNRADDEERIAETMRNGMSQELADEVSERREKAEREQRERGRARGRVVAGKEEVDKGAEEDPTNLVQSWKDKIPPLVAVVFGDVGTVGRKEGDLLGMSCGLGLRIGGLISVELSSVGDGRRSKLHFGLVDRSL